MVIYWFGGWGKEMEGGNPALILLRKARTLTAGGNYLLQILWVLSVVSCGWRDTPQKWNGLSEKRGQWHKGRIFPTVTGVGITCDGQGQTICISFRLPREPGRLNVVGLCAHSEKQVREIIDMNYHNRALNMYYPYSQIR